MKNNSKKQNKLTRVDSQRMWGGDGPYSQVRLCEEARILDDSISRIFLVVEAEINPFTFEYVEKNRKQFQNDEPVLQLLSHAENRGKFGYVVSAGEVELEDEESKQYARKQADMTIQTLIRMHKFVINEFNLEKKNQFGMTKDSNKLVWNDRVGGVEVVSDELWNSNTLIGSQSGVKNNKIRYFIVLAFGKGFDFKSESAVLFAKTLLMITKRLKVETENVSALNRYTILTALIPFDISPTNFIESIINECVIGKKQIFQEDYLVTNTKKPTQDQIMTFLAELPFDKNIQ